jgi:hypothetical protein
MPQPQNIVIQEPTITSQAILNGLMNLILQNSYELFIVDRIAELDQFAFIDNLNLDSFSYERKFVDNNALEEEEVITNASIIGELRSGVVLISYMDIPIETRNYTKLYSLEANPQPFKQQQFGLEQAIYEQNFTTGEQNAFNREYGESTVQFSFSINQQELNISTHQNSIAPEEINYNSLSSLGSISDESFTISATTGSVGELIVQDTETFSDVGGLSGGGRNREIESTGVTIGSTSTRNVRTSGY